MKKFFQGIILGLILVLPGMSGGTVFVIFGIYEDFIEDIAKFKIGPYKTLLIGMCIGMFLGGYTFGELFETYKNVTLGFLIGCLIFSTKSILIGIEKEYKKYVIFSIVGFVLGIVFAGEKIDINKSVIEEVSNVQLLIGGALSSAAMIIPGVPGSSVLIFMGIYHKLMIYIREFYFYGLSIYIIGAILGSVFLVKFLDKLYRNYRSQISYLFAGIILGSCKGLLPDVYNFNVILAFIIGSTLVYTWTKKTLAQ